MAKKIFSDGVFRLTKQQIKRDLVNAVESEPEYRREIARTFQMANRRIQNIEKTGLSSPAVLALHKGDINRYSKFSMSGDWVELKKEYTKALTFLRQPTSTVTGLRQYNRHLQKTYDLTDDEFTLMSKKLNNDLLSIDDSNFVERYLMRYKDFTGELEQTVSDVSEQIESEAIEVINALDTVIDKAADNIIKNAKKTENEIQRVMNNLNKFGL